MIKYFILDLTLKFSVFLVPVKTSVTQYSLSGSLYFWSVKLNKNIIGQFSFRFISRSSAQSRIVQFWLLKVKIAVMSSLTQCSILLQSWIELQLFCTWMVCNKDVTAVALRHNLHNYQKMRRSASKLRLVVNCKDTGCTGGARQYCWFKSKCHEL